MFLVIRLSWRPAACRGQEHIFLLFWSVTNRNVHSMLVYSRKIKTHSLVTLQIRQERQDECPYAAIWNVLLCNVRLLFTFKASCMQVYLIKRQICIVHYKERYNCRCNLPVFPGRSSRRSLQESGRSWHSRPSHALGSWLRQSSQIWKSISYMDCL